METTNCLTTMVIFKLEMIIKMTSPLVSVIIPVYNVEAYLEECLESVVNQTFENIEVIAVNDGSTDKSLEILNRYAEQYESINVIDQKNTGVSVARNRGIDEAKGKYVYFLDSDDYIMPNTIKDTIEKMEKYQLDIIRFGAIPFSENEEYSCLKWNQYDYSKFFESGKIYNKQEFLRANIKGFAPSPCLYIVKKDILDQHNIRFNPKISYEDELFSLEVFLNVNRAMYDENLYYRRRYRPGSTMTSQTERKAFDGYYKTLHAISELLNTYKLPDETKLIKRRIRAIYISLTLKQIEEEYKKEMLDRLKVLSSWEKFYFKMQYQGKEFVKKLLRY